MAKRLCVYNYADLTRVAEQECHINDLFEKVNFFVSADKAFDNNAGSEPGSFSFWVTAHFATNANFGWIKEECKSVWDDRHKLNTFANATSYLFKIKFDKETGKFERETKTGYAWKSGYLCKVLEYAKDCFIISALKTQNMYHVKDGKITELIAPASSNENKQAIQIMPGFDGKNDPPAGPFFIVSGKSEIWIGNLEADQDGEPRYKMQTLVKTGPTPYFAQGGPMFLKQMPVLDVKNGFQRPVTDLMVFSSQETTYANKRLYQIHEMQFHEDFKNVLRTFGYLPKVTVENVAALTQKNTELQKKVDELEGKLSSKKENDDLQAKVLMLEDMLKK